MTNTTNRRLGLACRSLEECFWTFLLPSSSDRIQTVNRRIMSWVFYHSAAGAQLIPIIVSCLMFASPMREIIRIAWKKLAGTNTLAYFCLPSVMNKKVYNISNFVIGPKCHHEPCPIKLLLEFSTDGVNSAMTNTAIGGQVWQIDHLENVFWPFFSPSASNGIWTINHWIISWVIYHCTVLLNSYQL
jgi:hypothetical protein